MNDVLSNKLVSVINQLQDGLQGHSAEAAQLALQAVRVDGISEIIIGIAFLLGSILLAFIAKSFISYGLKNNNDDAGIIGVFSALAGLTFLFLMSCYLLDIWNYVSIFNPKLALAHQVMGKVMG